MSDSLDSDPHAIFREIVDAGKQKEDRDRKEAAERAARYEFETEIFNCFEEVRLAFEKKELSDGDEVVSIVEYRARRLMQLKAFLVQLDCLSVIQQDIESIRNSIGQSDLTKAYTWLGALFLCEPNQVEERLAQGCDVLSPEAFERAVREMRDHVKRHAEKLREDATDGPNDDLMTIEELKWIVLKAQQKEVSKKTIKRCIGPAAIEGRGRGSKSYWHYLSARDALSGKYTSCEFPTLKEAKQQTFHLWANEKRDF